MSASISLTICPSCRKVYAPELMDGSAGSKIKHRQWSNGRTIQNCWPDATPIQREQLQTGLCSDDCWDEFLRIVERGTNGN